MKNLKMLFHLTIADIKMTIRDTSFIFWSLFFPFMIIGIFGVMDFANMGNNNVGLVYNKNTEIYAKQLKQVFEEEDDYKFHEGNIDDEITELKNDDRVIVLEFTESEDGQVVVNTYMSEENKQTASIIMLVAEKILADISLQMKHIELPFEVKQNIVNTENLRYIDYMVPGVIALSLMQGGLFSVIGAIVVAREKGILKRLFATPLPKHVYLIANIGTRMLMSLLQIAILIIVSKLVFGIKIVGSIPLVAIMSCLGSLVFLSLGFLFSGFAKTSEAARAMIMPVQMLFMFTGGVYFDRSVLPKWLFDITMYSPLTYLSDALKDIMVKGYDLDNQNIQTAFIALSIWLVALVSLSIKTFRWNGKE
ncbi:ABC transporter permease [Candidatus Dojkabacteria bacterium]|nr:ABC transporter permease [Candidatus Dojkabacteria bacterium]